MLGRSINVAALRAIFAGGGTGGHLFPAIAIADEIKKQQPDAEILFIGTKNKLEARVVPQKGYKFSTIWISGFRRSIAFDNLFFPLKVVVSLMQAYSIIHKFKPQVVVGTGGYVSGPVLYAATLLKIPTLIQEQNSYPGVTTRMLTAKVNEVHLTFEGSKKYLRQDDNVYVSGNPTRSDLENVSRAEALAYFGFNASEQKKTVLIFGGSLGAHSLNCAVMSSLDGLLKNNLRVIWQTGKEDFVDAQSQCKKYPDANIWLNTFIERMDCAYAASDLVICRAGATTIAELVRLGKPSILVPYPHAAANHQVENARSVADVGAAEILYDNEVSGKLLEATLTLFRTNRLQQMSSQAKTLGKPNAAKNIAARVIHLAHGHA
jgi:UDP-N-acetylglucosamine--N-acetylmuramyl-(pentapeptide) pyrophosphoryl-undecaprenol N-acetylglucosamine transferase